MTAAFNELENDPAQQQDMRRSEAVATGLPLVAFGAGVTGVAGSEDLSRYGLYPHQADGVRFLVRHGRVVGDYYLVRRRGAVVGRRVAQCCQCGLGGRQQLKRTGAPAGLHCSGAAPARVAIPRRPCGAALPNAMAMMAAKY